MTGAGAISHLPYDDLPNWGLMYALESAPRGQRRSKADARAISTGLLETLGVTLVEGRFFTDDESRTLAVIVDEMLARRLWPGRSAVGQQFLLGQAAPDRRVSVVGVVRHLRLRSLVEDLTPQIFVPYRLWQRSPMAYVVGTDRDRPRLPRTCARRSPPSTRGCRSTTCGRWRLTWRARARPADSRCCLPQRSRSRLSR